MSCTSYDDPMLTFLVALCFWHVRQCIDSFVNLVSLLLYKRHCYSSCLWYLIGFLLSNTVFTVAQLLAVKTSKANSCVRPLLSVFPLSKENTTEKRYRPTRVRAI